MMRPKIQAYNVMVVANASYAKFCELFLRSFLDNVDLNFVEKVFVIDVGLTRKQVQFFCSFPSVEVLKTSVSTSFNNGGKWGTGWQDTVAQKTRALRRVLHQTNESVIMIDADCIVVKDFSELIDSRYDIQIAHRPSHSVPYLASFVVAHQTPATLQFIEHWIKEIDTRPMGKPREGPAFCSVADQLGDQVRIGCIDRRLVSTFSESEFSKETYIIHLKGKSKEACRNLRDRERKSLDVEFLPIIDRYIGYKISRKWNKIILYFEQPIKKVAGRLLRLARRSIWKLGR
jgi:hypothetical protein